jgi:hypothetical protein
MQRHTDDRGTEGTPRPDPSALDRTDRAETILSVLEEDQLVKAKERIHWGRIRVSPGVRVLLWGLRLYVILMLVTVVLHVVRTVQLGAR